MLRNANANHCHHHCMPSRFLLQYSYSSVLNKSPGHFSTSGTLRGSFILLCRIISVECQTNFECTLFSCHLKLIWSLKFKAVLWMDMNLVLFLIWRSSVIYWCIYQTKSNRNQNQSRVKNTIEKVAPNSKFVGHSNEIIQQSKIGDLLTWWNAEVWQTHSLTHQRT